MQKKTSYAEFEAMARQGNLIPVCYSFKTQNITPFEAYLRIRDKAYSYLFESADAIEKWGRHSFIGYKPLQTAAIFDNTLMITGDDGRIQKRVHANPLNGLRDFMKTYRPVSIKGLSPFQGGFVGYFNYDLIRKWENLPKISPKEENIPESVFVMARRLILFDHLEKQMHVLALAALNGDDDLNAAYTNACREIEETLAEIRQPPDDGSEEQPLSVSELAPNVSRQDFEASVVKAKEHIVAGDAIQIVLSQCFSGDFSGDSFQLYRSLTRVNPSPYMFYLNYGEATLIGSSPEILVRLTDGRIMLRPIAGTRPRGKTADEDQALAEEMLADPKERAEHIMLVDLGRNDVGRVASPGSVSVQRFMQVEKYSHVMHIVSTVEGELKPELDAVDVFMATFPAGTVSGAPKVRALEIISELEPDDRGPYAGTVGYFGLNGNIDFCITIRTICIAGNRLSVQVGAGIVADSVPENEYEETLRKAAAMFTAIERACENDSDDR